MTQARPIWRRVAVLAIGGGLAFWLANLAISLTPLAAEYRAALSISYVPMLGEALVGGLILGCCVAYALVRRGARVPVKRPVLTAIVLSMVALTAVTLLIEVPAKFLTSLGADPCARRGGGVPVRQPRRTSRAFGEPCPARRSAVRRSRAYDGSVEPRMPQKSGVHPDSRWNQLRMPGNPAVRLWALCKDELGDVVEHLDQVLGLAGPDHARRG